jgi:hypothetical protein
MGHFIITGNTIDLFFDSLTERNEDNMIEREKDTEIER